MTEVEGAIARGRVRLPEDACLPEHAKIDVAIPGVKETVAACLGARLARLEQAADFEKKVVEESPGAGL